MLNLTPSSHNDRKAIIITDTTPQVDEFSNPAGWGTDFLFTTYRIAGSQTATLSVTQKHYDGTETTVEFDLTALGFFEGVSDQADLVFNLVNIGGTMSLVATDDFDPDDVDIIPDGIYTLLYTLTTVGDDETFTTTFVLSDTAEYILNNLALNLDSKLFSSNNTDFVQLVDNVVLEAILFAIERSANVGRETTVLNMLKAINNEEYEYYND